MPEYANDLHISAAQCRAARGYLGWNRAQLAIKAKVSYETLGCFENDKFVPTLRWIRKVEDCLEAHGIEIVNLGDDILTLLLEP